MTPKKHYVNEAPSASPRTRARGYQERNTQAAHNSRRTLKGAVLWPRTYKKYMRLAIREAEKNLKKLDGGPFGASIVKSGRVIAVSRNTVLKHDATCHAEINAIRQASKKLKTFDLSGCVIYSTTEPCPMCFGAIHWARIGAIIYGTNISDASKLGFCELAISNKALKKKGKAAVKIFPSYARRDCLELFGKWEKLENKVIY